jgi:hypothetical protein
MTQSAPAPFADASTLEAVRPEVRDMLLGIPAFANLPKAEQQQIAGSMVKVAAYMANPDGLLTETGQAPNPLAAVQSLNPPATAQARDPNQATRDRLGKAPGQVGADFQAGAVRQGVEQFGALVQKVDFPKFVGGLIHNVFQAIVESSIEQMRAYGELLSNVAKTVDEFAQDNITPNAARDWLSDKYPETFGIETNSNAAGFDATAPAPAPTATLTVKAADPEQALTKVSTDLGLKEPITDISDPESETKIVTAARLQIARGRQQLLSSMMMLGINRIVITDGHINAKVIFDIRASDTAARTARASMLDQQHDTTATTASVSSGAWFSPISAGFSTTSTSDHMATVQSAVEDTSTSAVEAKANLTGEVKVNFKSDYFPMDKMASPQMIAAIQGRSIPPDKPVSGT